MGNGFELTFLQKKKDTQVKDVTSHCGDANQIHYEISFHTHQDGRNLNSIPSISKDVEKLKHSYIASRTVKWCSHFEKQFDGSLKY